ncbi:MAG: methyltransferase [Alistipes sp.]|nr:methyltransferase [Alistipes sp.]
MFRFKHFTLEDEHCAMKVGTDGVLLGAWADVESDRKILDVGTGSGIVALMALQRNPQAAVVALDIDSAAVAQTRSNADATPWHDRVVCVCSDVADYKSDTLFDHIISNPPYFVENTHSPNRQRDMARNADSLPFEVLVSSAERLLRRGGRLTVVLPTESAALFRRVAFDRLWLSRLCSVHTIDGDVPKRVLMEFVLSEEPLMPCCTELTIQHRGGDYTANYIALTKDFYLNF